MKKKLAAFIIFLLLMLLTSETLFAEQLQHQSRLSEKTWELTGTVSRSGYAVDARSPRMRTFGTGSYKQSFGEQLTGNAKRVYNNMVNVFVRNKKADTVYVTLEKTLQYELSVQAEKEAVAMEIDYMVQAAFDAFKYDYPEVYWLGLVSYGALVKRQTEDGITICKVSQIKVIPQEDYKGAAEGTEQAAFISAVNAAYQQISLTLGSCSSTRDKVLAVHNYLCSVIVYDEAYDSYTQNDPHNAYIHSAAGVFLKGGLAVCEGYAKAFKILCAKFGIESVLITGNAQGGSHMWNYVKMDDGNWYLVDVTWDDQKRGISYTYFLTGTKNTNAEGETIGSERLIYLNFSPSDYTMTFAVPVMSAYAYDQRFPTHTHIWDTDEKQMLAPTCILGGYAVSVCRCGEKTVEFFNATEHSFKNAAVYNEDATCIKNGTKTYYCDYGCGTKGRTVTAPDTKIPATYTMTADNIRLKKGQITTKFKLTGFGPGDCVESWRSTKKSIVRVSGNADGTSRITARKAGKAEIVVTLKSKTVIRIPVRVQKKAVSAKEIQNVPKKLSIKRGKTKTLKPVIAPFTCKKEITYKSGNSKIASVTKKGKIKAKKKGKTVIIIECGSIQASCKVTVG